MALHKFVGDLRIICVLLATMIAIDAYLFSSSSPAIAQVGGSKCSACAQAGVVPVMIAPCVLGELICVEDPGANSWERCDNVCVDDVLDAECFAASGECDYCKCCDIAPPFFDYQLPYGKTDTECESWDPGWVPGDDPDGCHCEIFETEVFWWWVTTCYDGYYCEGRTGCLLSPYRDRSCG